MRTLLAGDGDGVCSGAGESGTDSTGEIEGDRDSCGLGEGVGVGESCAGAIATRATQDRKAKKLKSRGVIRDLSIVPPIHVRKNVVPPFAVVQKFFINMICGKLIVQTIEPSKVIDCALSRVFARSSIFD
jgi:hypothetical protein